jgi:phosphoribosylformylglycinamidine cyclo-ligase
MDRTFNNGLGMILIVGRRSADAVIAALRNMGEAGYIVGEIRRGPRGATISA